MADPFDGGGSGKPFNAVTDPAGSGARGRGLDAVRNPGGSMAVPMQKPRVDDSNPASRTGGGMTAAEVVTPKSGEQVSGYVGVGSLGNPAKPFKLGG